MSRLNELIADLCPNGVEHKRLGDIAIYSKERINASEVNGKTYVGVDNLLPDKRGKKDSSCAPTEGRLIKFCKGDILIGNIRPYLKKIWLAEYDGGTNGDVLPVHLTTDKADARFLYYCLSSDQFFAYDMQHAKGSKMPRGDKASVMEYRIPVPPIEVQREIVRILDNFTELTTKITEDLTAEVTARKKQYEHYKARLLSFGTEFNDSARKGTLAEE